MFGIKRFVNIRAYCEARMHKASLVPPTPWATSDCLANTCGKPTFSITQCGTARLADARRIRSKMALLEEPMPLAAGVAVLGIDETQGMPFGDLAVLGYDGAFHLIAQLLLDIDVLERRLPGVFHLRRQIR